MKTVFFLAGEASGDGYGAEIIRALKDQTDIRCIGMGGDKMIESGMERILSIDGMNVMGFYEVIKKYSFFKKRIQLIKQSISDNRPDALISIDYPGFNLRISEYAKKIRIPVFHFVAPQVWAWNRRRARSLSKKIDTVFVFHSFEKQFFDLFVDNVIHIGNPLESMIQSTRDQQAINNSPTYNICIAPGSRISEIKLLLPVFVDGIRCFCRQSSNALDRKIRVIISQAPGVCGDADFLAAKQTLETIDQISDCSISIDPLEWITANCHCALIASGTATLVAALSGCPMIVCYRASWASAAIGKRVLDIPAFSLVNIVAGNTIVPELDQEKAHPDVISNYLRELYFKKDVISFIESKLCHIRNKNTYHNPIKKATDHILDCLNTLPDT